MHWESSGMVGFDLGPLLEGEMRTAKLKSAYNLLLIGPRGFGALSLRWIQFASVLRCARSSFIHVLCWGMMVLDFLVWDSANAKPSRFRYTEKVSAFPQLNRPTNRK